MRYDWAFLRRIRMTFTYLHEIEILRGTSGLNGLVMWTIEFLEWYEKKSRTKRQTSRMGWDKMLSFDLLIATRYGFFKHNCHSKAALLGNIWLFLFLKNRIPLKFTCKCFLCASRMYWTTWQPYAIPVQTLKFDFQTVFFLVSFCTAIPYDDMTRV